VANICSRMEFTGCLHGMSDFLVVHCDLGNELMTDAREDEGKKMSLEEKDRLEGWQMNELQRWFIESLLADKTGNQLPEEEG